MRRQAFLIILSAMCVACIPMALAAWQDRSESSLTLQKEPTKKNPVPNYGIIWEKKLSRSALPKNESGWGWLREQGVNTVINFRQKDDVDYEKFGFKRHLWLPMSKEPRSNADVENFLKFVQQPDNWPVHIHCAEGKDRAGMMSALVRYAIDGWPVEKAIAEAKLYRRGEDLAPHRIEWLRQWATKYKPGSHRVTR